MNKFLAALSVLVFALALSADDKKPDPIDMKKLVGKWATKEKVNLTTEYTKDGKVIVILVMDDKETRVEGTYKADGTKLTLTMTLDGQQEKWERTVVKLTDTELTTKDDKGAERRFERAKDKK